MVTLKGSSIKTYSPQSRKDRRAFGFSFLLFADPDRIGFAFNGAGTPKIKMTQLFVEYNI
jgi:hypothetical protein